MLLASIFWLHLTMSTARAADMSVVDVRRNITLAENDPVYKDFYINAGAGSGLKKNLVVTAVRKVNVRDASGANAVGEITIPVGQLRVIAIYDRVAVAREYKLLSRDELPMLEQTGIMTGDRIDLQGSFVDNSKPKRPKTADATKPAESTTAIAAVVMPAPPTASTPIANSDVTVVPVTVDPVVSPNAPAPAANAPAKTAELVEKMADSGNNSRNE
jgi:hypothetical protein